jgi:hypothetical protein
MLENGGHFPVEHPAHEQPVTALRHFVESPITIRLSYPGHIDPKLSVL